MAAYGTDVAKHFARYRSCYFYEHAGEQPRSVDYPIVGEIVRDIRASLALSTKQLSHTSRQAISGTNFIIRYGEEFRN